MGENLLCFSAEDDLFIVIDKRCFDLHMHCEIVGDNISAVFQFLADS